MKDKLIYKDKTFEVYRFINPYGKKYIGMQFLVPESSEPSYRGFPASKRNLKMLSQMFKEVAKRLGKLAVIILAFGAVAKADMTWKVYVATNTEDIEHSQSVVNLSTSSPQGDLVKPTGAGFSCIITPDQSKTLAPNVTVVVREMACMLTPKYGVAAVTGCLKESESSTMAQLIVYEAGHDYLLTLACENTARQDK